MGSFYMTLSQGSRPKPSDWVILGENPDATLREWFHTSTWPFTLYLVEAPIEILNEVSVPWLPDRHDAYKTPFANVRIVEELSLTLLFGERYREIDLFARALPSITPEAIRKLKDLNLTPLFTSLGAAYRGYASDDPGAPLSASKLAEEVMLLTLKGSRSSPLSSIWPKLGAEDFDGYKLRTISMGLCLFDALEASDRKKVMEGFQIVLSCASVSSLI
jgi:hypothetical protein